jgi:hypothetical protein
LTLIVRSVLIGMLVAIARTILRNFIFAANLRYHAGVPWAVTDRNFKPAFSVARQAPRDC